MKKIVYFPVFIALVLFSSCEQSNSKFDASGTFEVEPTIVPAQVNGIIQSFEVTEGDQLKENQVVGYIDSTQLYLQKLQLEAQINSILSKSPNVSTQMASLHEKLAHALTEQHRIVGLYNDSAATKQQLDNVNANVKIIQKQIKAKTNTLELQSASLSAATRPIKINIKRLEDQLQKCLITNPINGTVLTTYVEPHEMAVLGKPLYKIANLSVMTLRAYITGNQFADIKLGQKVKVLVDNGKNGYKTYEGTINWISDQAEFTPKTIQTKKERVNKVYAIKINVKNDGYLKIGMFGQVNF